MRAQPPVRLVRTPAAPGTIAPRSALVDALAGAAVFGLADLGTSDSLDAGGLALAGPATVGGSAFLKTDRALAAAGLRRTVTAPRAKPHRAAPFGALAMALATIGAPLDISMGHWVRLPDRCNEGIGGPAGAGEGTRCAITGESAAAASDPR
ncbi:MAG: hypothetical protein OXJ56_03630 [Rhodospirillaceae bacterium]|nr:hypothetical protein [Rhodospirillaceae bacterium]